MIYNEILWAGLLLAALGTAVYMWRLYFLVFAGEYRGDEETRAHIHESPASMLVPLGFLAFLSILGGYVGLPHIWHFEGDLALLQGLEHWLAPSVNMATVAHTPKGELWMSMGLATGVALAGIGIAYALWGRGPSKRVADFTSSELGRPIYEAS